MWTESLRTLDPYRATAETVLKEYEAKEARKACRMARLRGPLSRIGCGRGR